MSKLKIFTDLALSAVPYSRVVGQSMMITSGKHGVVALLSIRVPQADMDNRTVAEAVAKALMSGHISKNGVTLVLPNDFAKSGKLKALEPAPEGAGEVVYLVHDWEYTDPSGKWNYARTPERAERLQREGVKLTPVYTRHEPSEGFCKVAPTPSAEVSRLNAEVERLTRDCESYKTTSATHFLNKTTVERELKAAEASLANALTVIEPFAAAADEIDQAQWPRPDWQFAGGEFKAGQLRAARDFRNSQRLKP